jgi:hypothetical protein
MPPIPADTGEKEVIIGGPSAETGTVPPQNAANKATVRRMLNIILVLEGGLFIALVIDGMLVPL